MSTADPLKASLDLALEVQSFNRDHVLAENMEAVSRIGTNVDPSDPNNVLARLETLSKQLSNVTSRKSFTIDPSDFDLAQILKGYLKNAKRQNLPLRSTGVVLKDVATIGVDESATFAQTFGTVLNVPGNIAAAIRNKGDKPTRRIINRFNGVVKAGEMCLVLGRPGAGCSTLLKTIAGEGLHQYTGTEGTITFDGIEQLEMLKKYRNDVVYNPELDVHFPHLTVEQTLKFAVGCKVPNVRVNAVTGNATKEQYINFKTDMLATIFGLRHTYKTKVGNDFVRGVSGGERKRVSIAEALAADAKVYCWDNATRGLDASTALEYALALRLLTNLLVATNFVTIYQASENIYEKFDKVTVLLEGRQIYFGPIYEAKAYFEKMGFECPKRQATPEFLTAITDPKGRYPKPGMEDKVPRTSEEFEEYWLKSEEFAALQREIEQYESCVDSSKTKQVFSESSKAEKTKLKSTYTVSYLEQLKLNFRRLYQIAIGDFSYLATQIVADIIQALITGSLYYNTPVLTQGAFSRGGTLFFFVLYYSLSGLASVVNLFTKRPILLKQKAYLFYHPSTEFILSFVVDGLFKLFGIIPFILIAFFLSNLKRTAGNFFIVVLFVLLACNTMNLFFQMIALLSPKLAVANGISGLIVLASVMYSCFMIQLPSMHPWFKWINWLNPVRYSFEAMMVNEFHHTEMPCLQLIPSGPGYEGVLVANQACAFSGSKSGSAVVSGDDYMRVAFSYAFKNLWRNFGILIGFLVFFFSICCLALEFISSERAGFDVLIFKKTPATQKIMDAKRSGDPEKQTEALPDPGEEDDGAKRVFEGLGSKDVFLWQHVDYDVTLKDGTVRRLLNDVQGYVKPGTLTALMGESGAGKTTLLNTLSQRIDTGVITGDMLVNGQPLNALFKRKTGYVQQQDVHFLELTVRESLRFAADLRRKPSVPQEERYDYAEQIIKILNMETYADALVGNPGYGLNVEQRKKLSIGVELVAKPLLLLFLDEPTLGLDLQSSWAIVKLLRDLANAGQAILCTIHQPSAVLFEEFDRLLLLKKGGYTVYFGDIGKHSRVLLDYFERSGARKCEDSENPAEYILEAIGAGATALVKEDWGEIWKRLPECAATTQEISRLIAETLHYELDENESPKELKRTFVTPYWYQLMQVTNRVRLQLWRDPTYIMAKFMLMVSGGLFIGFTYWDAGRLVIGMQNAMFSVFLSIIISVPLVHQIQDRALQLREVFEVRELKLNTYHWLTLLLAQFLNEIPYQIVFSTIFFISMYFPVHRNYDSFTVGSYYLFYCIIFQLYFVSLGLWLLYMAPNLPAAAVLSSLLLSFCIAFCGVVQPPKLMPLFWTFMWKVLPYTYFIQSFMLLSVHNLKVHCKASEFAIIQPPSGQTCQSYLGPLTKAVGGYINNPLASSNCQYCLYSTGDDYLASIETKFSYLWRNFGFMWVYIGFNICAMLFFYWLIRVRTGSLLPALPKFARKVKKEKTDEKVEEKAEEPSSA